MDRAKFLNPPALPAPAHVSIMVQETSAFPIKGLEWYSNIVKLRGLNPLNDIPDSV